MAGCETVRCRVRGTVSRRALRFIALTLLLGGATVHADDAGEDRFVRFRVNGFALNAPVPVDQSRVDEVFAPYEGRDLTLQEVQQVAKNLERAIREEGWSFVRIVLPAQELEDGVVRFDVLRYRIGRAEVAGNKWFSEENIRRSVPGLQTGTEPNVLELSSAANVASRHPAKNIRLTFREGDRGKTVDATLKVEDQKPWVAFALLQNNGNDETGHTRLTLGAQHGNLTGHDDTLNVSYTTAPSDHDAVTQYGLSYSYPFYDYRSHLTLFWADSSVNSGTIQGLFDVSGAGEISGAHLQHHLPRFSLARHDPPDWLPTVYDHSLTFGIEDRAFNNDIQFSGAQLGTDVRTRPASVRYELVHTSANNQFDIGLQYTYSLSGGGDNSDSAYAANRARAENNWKNWRGTFNWNYSFRSQWATALDVDWQYSEEPLVPPEQFGVGGIRSVRGYEEREATGDSGIMARLDLMAPPETAAKFLKKVQAPGGLAFLNDTRLFTFVDAGYVSADDIAAGGSGQKHLSSAGFGGLWRSQQFSLRLDVANAFSNTGETDAGEWVMHLFLLARY